ncbi:LigA [Actinotalea ferrariae CF5-4]|uniref:LigA n=1 Tax=Actinotalea ferrariae CF5-4 TaxID=948458 RepID=A0A021VUC0_9CELL|nr:glycosyltransferase family 2 protein [Actinotalea ferrariae]EYR64784.1 LigA [Actinotalea ferrariae CF5-4]
MRLVATLLVRDEADVVAATVEHHLDQGAELVVVTDNGSVDGTTEVLEAYARRGVVDLLHEPDHTYRQAQWVTRMAHRAAVEHRADWVLHLDADEFWVPVDRSRTVHAVLSDVPAQFGSVTARREDLVGRRGARGPWPSRLRWRDLETLSERGTPLAAKVVHRAAADIVVEQGNHAVQGLTLSPWPETPLDIYHVPLRSWEQFRRKIDNGGSAYAANTELDESIGWHWRADYERLQQGTLHAAYQDRIPRLPALLRAAAEGRVRRDSWLLHHLRALRGRAVRPDLLEAVLTGARPQP